MSSLCQQRYEVPKHRSETGVGQVTTDHLKDGIEERVFEVVGTFVSADIPLMEAGLDSLGMSELQRVLSEECSTELAATLLFDHPSIRGVFSVLLSSVVQVA